MREHREASAVAEGRVVDRLEGSQIPEIPDQFGHLPNALGVQLLKTGVRLGSGGGKCLKFVVQDVKITKHEGFVLRSVATKEGRFVL
jgi:hypothetical protein